MKSFYRWGLIGFLIAVIAGFPSASHAQFGKLKKKAEKKVEKKVDKKVDDAMDDAIDDALDGPDSDKSSDKSKSTSASETAGEPQSDTPAGVASDGAKTANAAAKLKPGEGAWANYDFIPGDRVIYYEDFERSPVGDFPERLEFEKGNMEVVAWEGSRYLRSLSTSDLNIPLPEVLPERFTLEFDLYLPGGVVTIYCPSGESGAAHRNHTYVEIRQSEAAIRGSGGGESQMSLEKDVVGEIWRCRLMGYKNYLKFYINETRVANIPNADFVRADKIHFYIYNFSNDDIMIDNIRVAEGGKKILYDALMADGRVATRGIYFDSGSDELRPESTPTLKQMGQMLQEHSDLRLLIEGHTDDQGDDASNQDLSERRAASVRSYLVSEYGIDGGRLESKGFGETNPVSPNGTPEGRQNNRRVELVKL